MIRRSAIGGAVVGVAALALVAAMLVGDDSGDEVATTGTTSSTSAAEDRAEEGVANGDEPREDGSTTSEGPPSEDGTTPPASPDRPITVPPSATSTPPATSPPAPAPTAPPAVRLTRVAGLSAPTAMATRPGDASGLYIAEKGGRVQVLRGPDVSTMVDIRGDVSSGSEQGLLGIAFNPAGDRLYLHFTDRAGDTAIDEWAVAADGRVSARRRVLSVDQPYSNHNGGMIAFGPDGLLYIALGDGGSGGDPQGNAQSLGTVLGKILRIDPRPNGSDAYRIPADNPFVGRAGARGEIWAYGLRNPWRFSFDRASGDLWIGDVGQNRVEEVDLSPVPSRGRGANYGWDLMEGNQPYEGSPPPDHVGPVHTYSRSGGRCAVTGGYVYRGNRIPALRGIYLFADYCAGQIMGLRPTSTGVAVHDLGARTSQVASFGEGPDGELYVLSLDGGVFRVDPT